MNEVNLGHAKAIHAFDSLLVRLAEQVVDVGVEQVTQARLIGSRRDHHVALTLLCHGSDVWKVSTDELARLLLFVQRHAVLDVRHKQLRSSQSALLEHLLLVARHIHAGDES